MSGTIISQPYNTRLIGTRIWKPSHWKPLILTQTQEHAKMSTIQALKSPTGHASQKHYLKLRNKFHKPQSGAESNQTKHPLSKFDSHNWELGVKKH